MAEIVSQENFGDDEAMVRVVRLHGSYGTDIHEMYVRLSPDGRAAFTCVSGDTVQKWQFSAASASAFVEAWQAYHKDYEQWKRNQISEARRMCAVHLGDDWKLSIDEETGRYAFCHNGREVVRSGEMKYLLPTIQEYIKREESDF